MALVNMKALLPEADRQEKGCGAFSVGNMEMIIGAVQAAEELNTPIILQIAQVRLAHSPLELMGPMMIAAAENAKVDIAVHLDHGLSFDVIEKALDMGFTSVMLDASKDSFAENIEKTCRVVELAKKYGAGVESELGIVGGSEDGSSSSAIRYTAPEEAQVFAEKTGIDALAVAIGNAHGDYPAGAKLAFDVLEGIRQKVDIPLVMHGGSGISDSDFRKMISLGIRKINVATSSFQSLTGMAEDYMRTAGAHNYFKLNEAMVEGVKRNVVHHIKVFNNEI